MGYDSWAGQPYGGSRFEFSTGAINISYQPIHMNFNMTNGVITDRMGNLLFSSNGSFIDPP